MPKRLSRLKEPNHADSDLITEGQLHESCEYFMKQIISIYQLNTSKAPVKVHLS